MIKIGTGISSKTKPILAVGAYPDSGVYYKVTGDLSAFDDMTDFTVIMWYEWESFGTSLGRTATIFSLYDGGSVDSGFYNTQYGLSDWYHIIGDGDDNIVGGGATYSQGETRYGGTIAFQKASRLNCQACVFDAGDTTEIQSYFLNSWQSKVTAVNCDFTNMGEIASNAQIRIGNHSDDTSTEDVGNCGNSMKILKVSLWRDTALTEENMETLTGMSFAGAGTYNDQFLYDVVGKRGAAGYTAASVTQPNHEWILDPYQVGTDSGRTGGLTLTAVGTGATGGRPVL